MSLPGFEEIAPEVALAGLAAQLIDQPWCLKVTHDLTQINPSTIEPKNRGPIPVLVVRVRTRRDMHHPEVPYSFPDPIHGHPVLVLVGTIPVPTQIDPETVVSARRRPFSRT